MYREKQKDGDAKATDHTSASVISHLVEAKIARAMEEAEVTE